jgi:hypothetical protein
MPEVAIIPEAAVRVAMVGVVAVVAMVVEVATIRGWGRQRQSYHYPINPLPVTQTYQGQTLPANPKEGQVFTYTDSAENVISLVYNAATKSWLLPVVSVPGHPPLNPVNGKIHKFTSIFTNVTTYYVYTGSKWGVSVARGRNSTPPKDPEIVQGTCEGYNQMLALQTEHTKETAAFVTIDGKVFILPMDKNTEITSEAVNQYEDAQGRTFISVVRATEVDAPEQFPRQWYLYHTTFDAAGKETVSIHLVTAHVHSHPMNGNNWLNLFRKFFPCKWPEEWWYSLPAPS